jgi:hypothetical protein
MPKGSGAVGGGMFSTPLTPTQISNLNQPAFVDTGSQVITVNQALNPEFINTSGAEMAGQTTYAQDQIADVTNRFMGGIGMSGPIDPATGGPAGNIGPRPSTSNSIVRAQMRAIRMACNNSGGYFAGGVCYTGQGAVDKATQQANADFEGVNKKGESWLEENADDIDDDGTFIGEVTQEQADIATAVNEQEVLRQQSIENVTGEDRSQQINNALDVIENTVVTAVDLLGDTTADDTTADDTTGGVLLGDAGTVGGGSGALVNQEGLFIVDENGNLVMTVDVGATLPDITNVGGGGGQQEGGNEVGSGNEGGTEQGGGGESGGGSGGDAGGGGGSGDDSGGSGDAGGAGTQAGGGNQQGGSASGGNVGGAGGDGGTTADILGGTTPQYVVIGTNPDGSVIIEDTVDGDIWILDGDYEIGDEVPEDAMGGATRGDGDIKTGKVEEPTDWYWDPVGQVWNAVYDGTFIPTGAVKSGTTNKPDEAPTEFPKAGQILSQLCDNNVLITVKADGAGGTTTEMDPEGCRDGEIIKKVTGTGTIGTVLGTLGDITTVLAGGGTDQGGATADGNAGGGNAGGGDAAGGGNTGGGSTGGGNTGGGNAGGGDSGGGGAGGGGSDSGGGSGGGDSGGGSGGGGSSGGGTGGGSGGGVDGGGAGGGSGSGGGGSGGGSSGSGGGDSTGGGGTGGSTGGGAGGGSGGGGTGGGTGGGDGPGDGPGDNGGDGLGGTGMLTALAALPTMAQQPFAPLTQQSIRIQAPEMLPDIVKQQDAVAQLASALSMPHGDKPSGRALNSLFGSLLNEKAV